MTGGYGDGGYWRALISQFAGGSTVHGSYQLSARADGGSGNIAYSYYTPSHNDYRGNIFLNYNQLYHVAVCKSGGILRVFVDGVIALEIVDNLVYDADIDTLIGTDIPRNAGMIGTVDDICIIKGKALWTENFTPPTSYLNLNVIGYLSNNDLYGVGSSGTFSKLASNYTGMTDAQKIEVFNNISDNPSISDIRILSMPINIIECAFRDDALNCTLKAIPKDQLVIADSLTILENRKIKNIDVVSTQNLKVAFTKDGENYYVFNKETQLWEVINLSEIQTKGMDSMSIKNIGGRELRELIDDKIGFAFYFSGVNTEEVKVSKIKIQYW